MCVSMLCVEPGLAMHADSLYRYIIGHYCARVTLRLVSFHNISLLLQYVYTALTKREGEIQLSKSCVSML